MVFKPNYGMHRNDRNRAAQARANKKQRKREEKSAQRQTERTIVSNSSLQDEKEK